MEGLDKATIKQLAETDWEARLDAEQTSQEIEKILLEDTVCKEERPAVLFSGGLDSAVVAVLLRKLGKEPRLYTFSQGESDDLLASRIFAEELEMELNVLSIEDNKYPFDIEAYLKRYQVDSVHGLAAYIMQDTINQAAKQNGADVLWNGAGADLLFAGDRKPESYGDPADKNWAKEFKKQQLALWYWRSVAGQSAKKHDPNKIKTISPFTNLRIIKTVIQIDPSKLWQNGFDKMPLRLLADRWGIPQANAWRDKAAAQASSGLFAYLNEQMTEEIDSLTNLRIGSLADNQSVDDNFLALRIWVAWMAERAGVVDYLAAGHSAKPPDWDELTKELGLK